MTIDNEIVLTYIGDDDMSRPTYEVEETFTYVKDVNCGKGAPCLYWCNPKDEPKGEPGYLFKTAGEIKFIRYEQRPTEEEKYNYMMLGRLCADCDYYLGCGNRYAGHLYYKNEKEHIAAMKDLYNWFPEDR